MSAPVRGIYYSVGVYPYVFMNYIFKCPCKGRIVQSILNCAIPYLIMRPYRGNVLRLRREIGVNPYPILCRPYGALRGHTYVHIPYKKTM